ncbi:MAG: hypothetical protein WCK71_01925 [bacterium]
MKLKNDKYRHARGGYSRLLAISCQKCDALVCNYQKDGPGSLRRMYIDRISEQKVAITGNSLTCKNGHILGTKIVYAKENRPAFRLITNSFIKKIIKS